MSGSYNVEYEYPDVSSDEHYTHTVEQARELLEIGDAEESSTKDLYLSAAYLSTKNGELMHTDKTDKRHMRFYFIGTKFNEIEHQWKNRTLQVNAADFADALRRMKSEIHEND